MFIIQKFSVQPYTNSKLILNAEENRKEDQAKKVKIIL